MILKAIASNQIARFAPGLYIKLTGQTGRGDSSKETAADIAQYFSQCVMDYLDTLGIPQDQRANFLQDKVAIKLATGPRVEQWRRLMTLEALLRKQRGSRE